jgi:integrase
MMDHGSRQIHERTKTIAGIRYIPIPDQVAEMIPASGDPMRPLFCVTARTYWQRIAQAWNISAGGTEKITVLPNYTAHILRHTCATLWALMRMLPDQLQYLLGHESVAISYGTYAHANKIRHMAESYRPYFPRYGGRAEVEAINNSYAQPDSLSGTGVSSIDHRKR